MTAQEAINNIDNVLSADLHYDESIDYQLISDDIDWLEKSKSALEKQIPKKVDKKMWIDTYCECGYKFSKHHGDGYHSIPYEKQTKYCPNCGQALDWSDTE